MGIFAKLFGGDAGDEGRADEQAVVLVIATGEEAPTDAERERVYSIQDELIGVLAETGAGEFEGEAWAGGCCTITLLGRDADALWAAVAPTLERHPFARGSHAVIRHGAPGAREDRINLEWAG